MLRSFAYIPFLFTCFLLLLGHNSYAQPATETRNLLPVPAQVKWGASRFALKNTWRIQLNAPATSDSAVRAAAQRLGTWLVQQTDGKRLTPEFTTSGAADLTIRYGKVGRMEAGDEERYSLCVTPAGIALDAPTSLGALRGLETLRQLLTKDKKNFYFAEVYITDQPRFGWRGLLIDAARHFMPVAVIKRNLDGMAAVKLNVMHWHLSDDQGFRVESKTLPRLHEVGSEGQYYTQAQVREVIRYAAARGIRVIPEFDMPGHATSWLAAYPVLASNDSTYGVAQRWGVLNIAMDPSRETTYQMLDTLVGEMTALFPDPYFHIGGDENDGRQWKRNPRIVEFMKQKGFMTAKGQPDKHALQTYFNRRILESVTARNKKMVGWDEILGPGLPPSAVIQSWRGRKGLYEAAKAGHATILSNGYYIDLNYSAASHYLNDPLPADAPLTAVEKQRILGGEATMWAEFTDSVIVDSRIWPRAAAIAERLWSPATVKDVPDMYRRLGGISTLLETLGLQHKRAPEKLLTQLAAGREVAPLRTFASVLEPVKEYKRHFQGMKYTTQTPLNRLVDAAPAESDAAREFGIAVDNLLRLRQNAPQTGSALHAEAKVAAVPVATSLRQWQLNDALVRPMLLAQPSLQEYAPLSAQLSSISALALERLRQMEKGETPSTAWQAAALKQLDAAKAPAGQAELAVVASVRKLIESK
ncbi:family 20 glycosylhydrolase [Hymenobacter sp. BT188]|uniref:beta-N-acetylhexosaminidase n=1 Tax=Hymenobacter sp. BT188 TaxID=2763504 RepID=UPI0016517164|nr:family 20 glycosylhydrolase [Hymenobacter sp. BT188]MBC6606677.1 family 20 glycosylhydrolase [Hymenobacter sp. BT188]